MTEFVQQPVVQIQWRTNLILVGRILKAGFGMHTRLLKEGCIINYEI